MTPEEFEKKIAWIEFLLKGRCSEVKWNEKIPDPDNPTQMRQVDIVIRGENHLTLVECRWHSKPQNVKWIEELHGRRQSLNANSVIAVSASGFTPGAIKKAERFGIILRDFKSLTGDEICRWGVITNVYLDYTCFFDVILHIVVNLSVITRVKPKHSMFQKSDGEQWPIDTIFKSVAKKLDETKQTKGSVKVQLFPKDLFYMDDPINELIFQSNFKKRRNPVSLPVVFVYKEPHENTKSKMMIERHRVSDFEIFRHSKSAFVIADLSVVPPMNHCVFKGIVFDFKEPISMEGIKIIGQKLDTFYIIPFKIKHIRKDSTMYRSLLSRDNILFIPD